MRIGKSIFLVISMVFILSACASFEPPYAAKGYEEAPDTDVAIIVGSRHIDIVKQRDERTGTYVDIYHAAYQAMHSEFRLLPGSYCIFYSSSHTYITPGAIGMGCFDLEAGHQYRVDTYRKTRHYSRIWFEDMTTGAIISDVGWTSEKEFNSWHYRSRDFVERHMEDYIDH